MPSGISDQENISGWEIKSNMQNATCVRGPHMAATRELCQGRDLVPTMLCRLEAKSEKGPRNHLWGDGMLEDVTHAGSPD